MTANKIKKQDLDKLFSQVDIKNFDKNAIYSIKYVIKNEVKTSLVLNEKDQNVSERNYICFYNMMRNLENNDLENAWWELTDIISFHRSADYLSVNEIVLIDVALTLFIDKL